MNKKRKDNKIGTLILIIAVIVFTILGVISLRYNFKKFNRAAGYSERILNIYVNSKDKKWGGSKGKRKIQKS